MKKVHPLHHLNAHSNPHRNIKATIFHNYYHTNMIISELNITHKECKENHKHTHNNITFQYLSSRKITSHQHHTPWHPSIRTNITTLHAYKIGLAPNQQITTLAKLPIRNKSKHLHTTMPTVLEAHTHYQSPFQLHIIPMQHHTSSLWTNFLKATELIQEWESRLATLE